MNQDTNIDVQILKKCGWDENQLNFMGTMVHNITKNDGTPIADIVSNRTKEQVAVEWFVPNKEGNKISMTYSLIEGKIIPEKTDLEIRDEKSLNIFLDNIENTIKGFKSVFFPKNQVIKSNEMKNTYK